ncbi:hypothetical protein BGZ99_001114 [Dissophora globulifera]|uniref:PQ-loop-domain-containing protein n=1 Tax=Dissophora globulifera TaxID=979702 RepID=A0A9P6R3A4_9FUNG|nr:hypothetical protein BGZ99_001114 [Dissophora globulifera]
MPTARVIVENVFGYLGIIFWSFQLLPQVIANYKSKSAKGLSPSMFAIWTLASLGFGAYSIVEGLSIPIILQPHLFGFFSTTCFIQCLYYGGTTNWSKTVMTLFIILTVMLLAGIEVAAVYGTRAGVSHDVPGTIDAAGILPVVLLFLGFLPQYKEIIYYRSVVGVSMVFIAADASGSVFSLISLAFSKSFDLLAALNYIIVLVCDLAVVAFYIFYNKCHPSLARFSEQESLEEETKSDLQDSSSVSETP